MRITCVAKPLYKYTDNTELTKTKRGSDSDSFVFLKTWNAFAKIQLVAKWEWIAKVIKN